jgi:hypothetical protein
MILESMYQQALWAQSDINEHCYTLRKLAEQCNHVTEFGTRYGVSTVSLLSGFIRGKLRKLISYDIEPRWIVFALKELYPQYFDFVQGSSLSIIIEKTDLLFIDTLHTEKQLSRELLLHSGSVSKYIVIHDTEKFWISGEYNEPGLRFAVERFLESNVFWKISEIYHNNNGLMVLKHD